MGFSVRLFSRNVKVPTGEAHGGIAYENSYC